MRCTLESTLFNGSCVTCVVCHSYNSHIYQEDVEPYYEAYTCLAKMLEKSNLKVLYHYLIFTAREWYHTDCECLLQYFLHGLHCS